MVFSSPLFICLFLPVVLLFNAALGKKYRNGFLFAASLLFYAWGEPAHVLLLLCSVIANYLFARVIETGRKRGNAPMQKAALIAAVALNLLLLFVCKYLRFTLENLQSLLRLVSGDAARAFFSIRGFALPIGISFFAFQAISYVVDVYRGEAAEKNPVRLGLSIALFAKVTMGPIVRYRAFSEQLDSREIHLAQTASGLERFIVGLGKKVLIADTVAIVADHTFGLAAEGALNCGLAWFGAVCYALQIYFDFSGYSDMAIGVGRMLGFALPENFNYPYMARTVTDFWRRWHITLGAWFRDYVYIPLGGSRVGKPRLVLNLLIVWLMTGIWHGANWTFAAWGLLYFLLLTFEKLTGIGAWLKKHRTAALLYRICTLLSVLLGWVLFRADSIKAAGRYFKSMFALYGPVACAPASQSMMRAYAAVVALATVLSLPLLSRIVSKIDACLPESVCLLLKRGALLLLLLLCLATCVASTYHPFIYFQF